MHKKILTSIAILLVLLAHGQEYPKGYFRSPLNIPLALVANFGEIRPNHWHMGLDIRTQQRENLPVYAAADGYVSRILVEPAGFGQAIYITHPNGFTTLYAHLNAFYPPLQQRIKEEQYKQESWRINLQFSPGEFPVKKGDYIALSGNTGGSAGPHVHFEIRDTKTEKVLNPLLFGFPLADNVPPSVVRLAMYDGNRSTYQQSPQLLNLATIRNRVVQVYSTKVRFAVGATDRFTGSNNPNGIYATRVVVDGQVVSGFTLDNIGYNETRYINAQLDYPFAARGGAALQHLSPLPGAREVAYQAPKNEGLIYLTDNLPHNVIIEIEDAYRNTSRIAFEIQYSGSTTQAAAVQADAIVFAPNERNIFERDDFQLVTTDQTLYDTVAATYSAAPSAGGGNVSSLFHFLSAGIPVHDSVTVRIKPSAEIEDEWKNCVLIKNVSGTRTVVEKAVWQKGWLTASFRQFGSYQAVLDKLPPNINNLPANVSKAKKISFTPTDNFNVIKSFRAELDGKWLRFSNDKGKTWVYTFDEQFPPGEHELKVRVEDAVGNVTEKVWRVTR